MSVTICQSMGFVVSALGVGGIIASTCMDQWSTQDLYNNPVTAVFNYQGLWRTCVRDSSGFTECRGYFTILGLPGLRLHRLSRGDIMSTTICQVMGFLVSSLGVAGCIVSTAMDSWSTQDLYDNPVTAVFQYQGLWRSCVRQSSGFTECRPYFTILGLPAMFQAVRALMIVGIVLGILGLLVCIFALKCIRIGTMEDSAKANMTLTSGIMFIIAGLCAITGVSVFANMLVTNFWMSTANMYQGMQNIQNRYTFGSALFVGWVAGGLALVGGILMCLACRGLIPEETRYKAVSYNASGPNISYRTGPYKVASGYEPETKARKSAGYEEAARSEDGRRSYPSKYDYV